MIKVVAWPLRYLGSRWSFKSSRETIPDVYSIYQDGSDAGRFAAQIYRGLREGDLGAEPVVELACLMEEADLGCPPVREILERPAAELTSQEVARLGRDLLRATGFDQLWATLETAVKVVEGDVRAAGIDVVLGITFPNWDDSGCARVGCCGGYGSPAIWPSSGRDAGAALVEIADAVQDVVIEHIWGVWPICPEHRLGLHAAFVEGTAVWQCAGAGTHTAAAIGDLGLSSRQRHFCRSK
ncbi:hypothetical protein [Microbispora triticiradicis]|uniref:hypothetical protein n=1 Tax=Microbispora triticiradicis TaxID=2200763 RepID=UPI001058FC7B|nr:hypothetical protein [Microbispora triticiradicis]